MKISILVFCIFIAGSVNAVVVDNYPPGTPEYSKVYDASRNPFNDGRDALALAKKTNRLVLIEVGGDWCVWCHVLSKFIMDNKDVYDTLYNNYVVLKVSVDDENDNKEFLSGLPKTNGYPHLFITKNDGTVIHSTDTTRLVVDGKYVRERIMAFLEYWPDKESIAKHSLKHVLTQQ